MSSSQQTPPVLGTKLLELDFRELGDHPLLAEVPLLAPDTAEFVSLKDSIAERGLDYPLLVDRSRRILDGRNRRNALKALAAATPYIARPATGSPTTRALAAEAAKHPPPITRVPCRVVDDHEVAGIVISSLVHRRHLTKGARAYLVYPMLAPALEAARTRALASLKRGQNSPSPIPSATGKSVTEIGARYGFSADLLQQAARVRTLLEKHPALRANMEERIITGELGLGSAVVALTNHFQAAIRAKKLAKRHEHDRLFTRFLPKLSAHWSKANPAQRDLMRTNLRTAMLTWPPELVADIAKIARDIGKEHAFSAVAADAEKTSGESRA